VCKWLEGSKTSMTFGTVEAVFQRAEVLRLYKCTSPDLNAQVQTDVAQLLQ
jgi:hypothetical protein